MKITKKHIIANAHSTRDEQLAEGWARSYNLRLVIGEYTLSIGVGEGLYCTPREVLEDVSAYTAVECAILKPNGGLMDINEVTENFGDEVASLCEGYGFTDFHLSSTVLPYIIWEEVEMVANRIRTTVDASQAYSDWNEEMCEPF